MKKAISEAEVRRLIDGQLRKVGWEVDTATLRYSLGARPKAGHDRIIAEWPTGSQAKSGGYADYAVFLGEKLVGFIEAKAAYKNLPGVLDHQAKDYAKSVRPQDAPHLLGDWRGYRVPFVFAANGRKYLQDLELESGIWFQDLRAPANKPHALRGWFSPQALADRLALDPARGDAALAAMPAPFLTDPDGLNLRPYQLTAIEKAQEALLSGQQRILLAMATGTGKTRTILGLIYKLLTAGRFRRILFLVDRNSLGEQVEDVFNTVRLEDLKPLKDLYSLQNLKHRLLQPETNVHITTVQGMMQRILYCGDEASMPSAGDYDLVIVDEAHRGYINDKERDETEKLYRDELDFQSKYRQVIEYFDAVKIGMTATPAAHTIQIFGKPVFVYKYDEAVVDGWLVDHEAPHLLTTLLARFGIHHHKGETVKQYQAASNTVSEVCLEDELDFEIDDFNRQVITEPFNRAVLEEIAKDIDPEDEHAGKTLIYAVNDRHADMIVDILREIYGARGVDTDAILKITGSIGDSERIKEAIRQFHYERFPSIVVTVDLLTTGIDIPSIDKLVFLRQVKSRILFAQMMGRATRLCPAIGKTHFEIYDAVGVYGALAKQSEMLAVAADPATTFAQLLEGIRTVTDPEALGRLVRQLAAKLQRRKRSMTPELQEDFQALTGKDPAGFAAALGRLAPQEARDLLLPLAQLFARLDSGGFLPPAPVTISDRPDRLLSHVRGYGPGNQKPEDYLHAFAEFVRTNPERLEAINIISSRPKDLTRAELKKLVAALKRKGFTEEQLNGAISRTTNTDMAADIIGLIRSYALGVPLLDKEARIRAGVRKLKQAHAFTKMQQNWIDRFEKSLLNEPIMNLGVLDEVAAFREHGGSARLDRVFDFRLAAILDELNAYLYEADGGAA
ncbi:MAG: type I restriction-modification system endonuclease [Desulfovibrio sp.]|nr:type I restriction-modification system endonuclease [Desulfovibrio sp.]